MGKVTGVTGHKRLSLGARFSLHSGPGTIIPGTVSKPVQQKSQPPSSSTPSLIFCVFSSRCYAAEVRHPAHCLLQVLFDPPKVPSLRYSATLALTRRAPRVIQLARYSTPAEPQHVCFNKSVSLSSIFDALALPDCSPFGMAKSSPSNRQTHYWHRDLCRRRFLLCRSPGTYPGLPTSARPYKENSGRPRKWLGCHQLPQETRHDRLQCRESIRLIVPSNRSHLKSGGYQSSQLFPFHTLAS